MAVTKRLRYEILRRDNHTCRYCGATAPDVRLTVDHVIPVALGGSDEPTNLVAACADCNAGKSSASGDARQVEDAAASALKWADAIQRAADIREAELGAENERLDTFNGIWTAYWITVKSEPNGRWHAPRPSDWRRSILAFYKSGLDENYFISAVRQVLYENRNLAWEDCWRYFCGVCWRELELRREIALELLASDGTG